MKLKKILSTIDSLEDKYLDTLENVCNIESPTLFKEGVDRCGQYFTDMATARGWQVEVCKQAVSGNAICITLNPDAEGTPVCVSAHLDTVHPVGLFGNPPTHRDDKNMYGPGVMDCKGGAVAAFMAMDALDKCGFKARPVKLILQSDEENSSATSNKGTIEFMCQKAQGAAAFLNLEGIKGETAVVERKGILRYKFICHGKALHSSRCPEAANAVTEAAHKIIELEKYKDPAGLTCNCGVISGGTVANTVAEECSFFADIRFVTNEQLAEIKQKAQEIADKTYVPGCSCTLQEVSFRPAMPETETNMKLLDKINKIYAECGLPVLTARKCLSGSDAAYITQCGIPCLDNLGVEGSNIHSIHEYAVLASLKKSAKRIAAVVYGI
ncbi:MAG: M20/M25/M40 family metallo-hydrolase [Clostridia bacterium]|nr:M20/M25/M40 family metallo-hydrolase [Clostridia bacterium]